MAKLVILTLEYREAKALAAKCTGQPMDVTDVNYREGLRKLQQALIKANPLEKKDAPS